MDSSLLCIERLLVEVKPNQQRIYVGGEKYSFFKIIFCGSGKAFTINDLQKKFFDEMRKYLEEGPKTGFEFCWPFHIACMYCSYSLLLLRKIKSDKAASVLPCHFVGIRGDFFKNPLLA